MSPFAKLVTYFQASLALGNANLRGLPLLPKRLWAQPPSSRAQYNTFINWLSILQLPSLRTVIDVGANTGDFTQATLAIAPEASVYMVEPLPSLHGQLKRLCAKSDGRLHLSTKALSDKPGEAELYFDPSNHTIGSLLGFNQEYKKVVESLSKQTDKIVCETETLDTMTRSANLGEISLIKIDVEGFEFHVLEGGKETLSRTEAVIVELSLVRNAGTRSDPLALMIRLLNEQGFSIIRVLPSLYSLTSPWKPVEFNVLARRGKLESL